jgi:hypothetical protein
MSPDSLPSASPAKRSGAENSPGRTPHRGTPPQDRHSRGAWRTCSSPRILDRDPPSPRARTSSTVLYTRDNMCQPRNSTCKVLDLAGIVGSEISKRRDRELQQRIGLWAAAASNVLIGPQVRPRRDRHLLVFPPNMTDNDGPAHPTTSDRLEWGLVSGSGLRIM